MTEVKRSSKRTSKPNRRYIDDDLDDLRDVKRNLPKTKAGGITSFEHTVPKSAVPAMEQSMEPSNKAVPGKSNADHLNVEATHKPAVEKYTKQSVMGIQKGNICSRKDLRPKLIKGTTFVIDCCEMAESALKGYNMNVADLEMFLHQNMKMNKNNKITTEQGEWKLMVTSKMVVNDKKSFNKSYLKLLIKKFLWKHLIKDWVYVDARLPTTLTIRYYRTELKEVK